MFQLKGVFLPLAEIITNMRKSCWGGSAIYLFIFSFGGGGLVGQCLPGTKPSHLQYFRTKQQNHFAFLAFELVEIKKFFPILSIFYVGAARDKQTGG